MITIAACLWAPNQASRHFSRCYDESWVDRLYRGCARNLTVPFRMVVLSDSERNYQEPVEQMRLLMDPPHYGAMIETFRLDCPLIVMGLDTVIVGNIDHLAHHALTATKPAVPKDPFYPASPWPRTDAIVVAPAGCKAMLYDDYDGRNDMDWINTRDTDLLDEIFPGSVVSYKGRIQYCGLEEQTSVVFFHGAVKPHEIPHVGWVARHWHDLGPSEAVA